MPLGVKVDEDLPEEVAKVFADAGYPTATVRSQGLTGALDEDLWTHAAKEGRWLISADRAFGDIRKYPPGAHPGNRFVPR